MHGNTVLQGNCLKLEWHLDLRNGFPSHQFFNVACGRLSLSNIGLSSKTVIISLVTFFFIQTKHYKKIRFEECVCGVICPSTVTVISVPGLLRKTFPHLNASSSRCDVWWSRIVKEAFPYFRWPWDETGLSTKLHCDFIFIFFILCYWFVFSILNWYKHNSLETWIGILLFKVIGHYVHKCTSVVNHVL